MAPFILKNRYTIYVALFSSLTIRAYLFYLGIGAKDPWSYRFFPSELALFLLGALAHQVLLPKYRALNATKLGILSDLGTYFLIFVSIIYFLIPVREVYKTIGLFIAFLLLIPLAFIFQNRSKIDSIIGNLSFPIYVSHMLVIFIVTDLAKYIGFTNDYVTSLLCILFTILISILIEYFIGSPFEIERKRANNRYKDHVVCST